MSKIAVIYKSKYGFTKKYAEWISQTLGADLLVASKVKVDELQKYTTIIYGGGLYAGSVSGISIITKNFDALKDKNIYLFTVGSSDVQDNANIEYIRAALNNVLTPDMQNAIKIYHFRGGLDYTKMSFIHRAMMGMMIKMLSKKPDSELSNDQKQMIQMHGKNVDFFDKDSICDMIQDINNANV